MNVTVIGNVNYDIVKFPGGLSREGYGGILYNVIVLANILPGGWTIVPVAPLGEEDFPRVAALLRPYPNVKTDGFYLVSRGINRCYLDYRSPDERIERLEENTVPIPLERVKPYLDADLIFINFISGRDLELETLKKVRELSDSLVTLDLQSLSLSMDGDVRKIRPIPDFDEVVACGDIVHLSVEDLMAQLGEPLGDLGAAAEKLAAAILDKEPVDIVLVTLGTAGSHVYARGENGLVKWEIPVFEPDVLVDTTGCGDAYTTAFSCHFAINGDPRAAGVYAARVAGKVAGLPDLDSLHELSREFTLNDQGGKS